MNLIEEMMTEPTLDYEPTKMYLSALTEEYRAVCDEARQASLSRLIVMQLGATMCAAVMGAAAHQWKEPDGMAPVLLLIVVPILAAVSLLIWIGEARRFSRAKDYICLLERKFCTIVIEIGYPDGLLQHWPDQQRGLERYLGLFGGDVMLAPLTWERWRRTIRSKWDVRKARRLQYVLLHGVRTGFFPAIMVTSLALGHLQLAAIPTNAFGAWWWVLVAMGYCILIVSVAVTVWLVWEFLFSVPDVWPEIYRSKH